MRDWRKEIQKHLDGLNLDPAKETEIVEELNQHLNDKYEEYLANGNSSEDAYKEAIKDLNASNLYQNLRPVAKSYQQSILIDDGRQSNIFGGLWKDFRHGARLLRLNAGFALVAILSLTLGIGANTAIFQLINAVRLRTLPVKDPQQLVEVRVGNAPNGRIGAFLGNNPQMTFSLWENLRNQQQAFSNIAAWGNDRLNLTQGGEARYADTMYVSGSLFDTVGVKPQFGRLISTSDDQVNCANPPVVLSNSFWKREFGGSHSALGRKITLQGHSFEIIGITPSSFFGLEVGGNFDVAIPACSQPIMSPEESLITMPTGWWLGVIGRLKPDWTFEKAKIYLGSISPGIFAATLPPTYDSQDKTGYLNFVLNPVPAGSGISSVRTEYETPLWLLMAISGLVLLIACANLANLMFARATVRAREMAVRLALGASRSQLIRQLLAESALLAFVGALCGVALSQVLSRLLVSFLSTERDRLFLDLNPDWRVLLFTTSIAILTCILFGLLPAIQSSKTPPAEVMKTNSRGTTEGRERFSLRRALVVFQVALSLVLLIGALLFVGTFRNLVLLDAGFHQDGILVTIMDLSSLKLPVERRNAYKHDVLTRIRAIPGVQSAASAAIVPLSGSGWNDYVNIPELGFQRVIANFNQVSSGYFETIQTPILLGRDFNKSDTAEAPLVAIVTEAFAKKFVQGKNPVGMTFRKPQPDGKPDLTYQIVGLVKDAKYRRLREEFTPIVFVHEAQDPEPFSDLRVMIRSGERIGMITSAVKQTVGEINPSIVINFRVFRTMIREGLLRERLMATLSGFFGFLAAVLAMVGLYGVISYMVTRRRNEIGIRMALGADRQSILSMIMREAGTLLISGLAIGTVLAIFAGSAARALLFGAKPSDPFTLLIAIAGLGLIAAIASFVPAKRASTLDPMQALREE